MRQSSLELLMAPVMRHIGTLPVISRVWARPLTYHRGFRSALDQQKPMSKEGCHAPR